MSDDKLTFASIAGLKICVNDALPPDTAVFLRGDQVTRIVHLERDARIAAFREAVEMVGEMEIGSTSFYAYCLLRARADELEKEEK